MIVLGDTRSDWTPMGVYLTKSFMCLNTASRSIDHPGKQQCLEDRFLNIWCLLVKSGRVQVIKGIRLSEKTPGSRYIWAARVTGHLFGDIRRHLIHSWSICWSFTNLVLGSTSNSG